MTPTCEWEGKRPDDPNPCQPVTHIVAWQCDKCDDTGTRIVCTLHHTCWLTEIMKCGYCNGNLSFKTRNLETGATQTRLNPITIPGDPFDA